jgi:hypothetical protein
MRSKKKRPIIAAGDVEGIFNDAQVAELAKIAKLPSCADLAALAEGVRQAASIFVHEAGIQNGNELHNEIAELHKASDRHRYDEVAALMEKLSPQARDMLKDRGVTVGISLPAPDALRDPARRQGAGEMVVRLCQFGGRFVAGRRRPSGKQSRPTWRPLLRAPEPRRNFAKRDAERNFIMLLSIAWHEATGAAPSRTARNCDDSRDVGPFARFARECLRRLGALDADVVELINEMHRRRIEMEQTHDCRTKRIKALSSNNP